MSQRYLDNDQSEDFKEFKAINKKRFYQMPIFYFFFFILVLALFSGAAAGSFYYLKLSNQKTAKQKIRSTWSDIVSETKIFNRTTAALSSTSELKNLGDEATALYDFLNTKQTDMVNLDAPQNYARAQAGLIKTLSKLSDYILEVKVVLNKDPLNIGSKDFKKLKAKADVANLAQQNFIGNSAFIQISLPKELFNISKILEPIIKNNQKQSQIKQAQALKQGQEVDKLEATKTVTDYQQARIQDNFVLMRRYLTAAQNKSFDPEAEKKAQGGSHPVDFKVTVVTLNPDNTFIVDGEETNKDYLGKTIIFKWRFKVIKEQTLWLIDNRELLK